jgi:hypothetical protein
LFYSAELKPWIRVGGGGAAYGFALPYADEAENLCSAEIPIQTTG